MLAMKLLKITPKSSLPLMAENPRPAVLIYQPICEQTRASSRRAGAPRARQAEVIGVDECSREISRTDAAKIKQSHLHTSAMTTTNHAPISKTEAVGLTAI